MMPRQTARWIPTLVAGCCLLLAACGSGASSASGTAGASSAPASASSSPAATGAPVASSPAPSAASSASTAASGPTSAAASPSPAAAPSSGSGASAASGLTTIRIGLSSASPSNAGVYVADGLGYFAKQGIKLRYISFNAASAVAPALATNRVDVADVGINPAMFNTMAAALGAKLVADKGSQPKGFGFTSIVVRKDLASKIKGPADFKGVNLAMTPPGLGTSNGYALGIYLAKAKLTPSDLHIQPIAFPLQVAALQNKAVDAAIMAEPFATEAVNTGLGVRLASLDQIVPGQQVAGLAYAAKFISQQPALANRFMVAYVQGIRTYDAAFEKNVDKTKIIDILAQKTPVKSTKLWSQMIPAGLNPDGKLNIASINDQEAFFKKLKLVKPNAPSTSSFIDESFVNAADKQLGPDKLLGVS